MENIFGGLIEFESEKDFDDFLTKMDIGSALSIIEKSLEFAHNQNVFSVPETYFIYKSLKKIKDGFNSGNGELQQSEGNSSQQIS
jgi:hypothetical protein